MLAAKDNEIRFIHNARIDGGALNDKFLDTWKLFFSQDRWFCLSDMDISAWSENLMLWIESAAGSFIMKIGLSPGSDVKINTRETILTIERNGTITMEEFIGYAPDFSSTPPGVIIFEDTVESRITYFSEMVGELLGEGFGAKKIEMTSTVMLADLKDRKITMNSFKRKLPKSPKLLTMPTLGFSVSMNIEAIRSSATSNENKKTIVLKLIE